jgi:hypothetical protein
MCNFKYPTGKGKSYFIMLKNDQTNKMYFEKFLGNGIHCKKILWKKILRKKSLENKFVVVRFLGMTFLGKKFLARSYYHESYQIRNLV